MESFFSKSSTESVSKYFLRNQDTTNQSQPLLKPVVLNDSLDDFCTPPVFRAKPKKNAWKLNKESRRPIKKSGTTKLKNATLEIVSHNLETDGDNPEHLQMALALSKSSYEAEHGQCETNADISTILLNAKPTSLERFGFKATKSTLPVTNWKPNEVKKKQKGRFKYITPVLNLRTNKDRESLIDSKISLILNRYQQSENEKICTNTMLISQYLETFTGDYKIFDSDRIYQSNNFYVPNLNLPIDSMKCGFLLKDWSSIPGRDKSPCRHKNDQKNMSIRRCMSPDLFGSDAECIEDDLARETDIMKEILNEPISSIEQSIHIISDSEDSEDVINATNISLKASEEAESSNIIVTDQQCDESLKDMRKESFSDVKDESVLASSQNTIEMSLNASSRSLNVESYEIFNTPTSSRYKWDNVDISENFHHNNCNTISVDNSPVREDSPKSSIELAKDKHERITRTLNNSNNVVEDSSRFKKNRSKQNNIYNLDEFDEEVVFRLPSGKDGNYRTDITELHNLNNSDSAAGVVVFDLTAEDNMEVLLTPEHKDSIIEEIPNCQEESLDQIMTKYNTASNNDHLDTPLKQNDLINNWRSSPPSNHKSRGYNSADLNITDYVNNLLSQDQYSFETNEPEIPLSQNSKLDDAELNYSCHYAVLTETQSGSSKSNDNEQLKSFNITTPENYLIKTDNVTPMPNYDSMNTPSISKELKSLGVKPLKRARGVKLLKYIYETTHPVVDVDSDEDEERNVKKSRNNDYQQEQLLDNTIVGDKLLEVENPEHLIFERKQSVKIHTCRVPLQIVWQNFLNANPTIKENILLYEPLQLEVLHAMLKDLGFKFHIQDLLNFLDRKCITIRTAQKKTNS